MPDRCVVFGCSNRADAEKGISLHRIPFWNDERPEAKRRRKIWVNFVVTKRANWAPSKFSAICSEHFVPDDYDKYLVEVPGIPVEVYASIKEGRNWYSCVSHQIQKKQSSRRSLPTRLASGMFISFSILLVY